MNETQRQAFALVGIKSAAWLRVELGMSAPTLNSRLLGVVDFKLGEADTVKSLYDKYFSK